MAITYHAGRRIQGTSASATGGTITTNGTKTVHTFTSSGTFTPSTEFNVEYLVIGGGGAGQLGGGGAGGYRTATGHAVTAQAYTITVGSGGTSGSSGVNSVFDSITADGGGNGGTNSSVGGNGGSGGGGGVGGGIDRAGGTASSGQGFDGGTYLNAWGFTPDGGGGGGAGELGNADANGAGGDGLSSSITGSAVTRGGGGGAGYNGGSTLGGDGGGAVGADIPTVSGTANTGGGGGGGYSGAGTNGGSGIVIISYEEFTAPTNVQVGSRFEETDTQKMYHAVDITGADVSLTGLKAYWKFNETTGDIINQATSVGSVDSLGTGADLQVTGATHSSDNNPLGNPTMLFDGVNDFCQAGSSVSQWNFMHNSTSLVTVVMWCKFLEGSDTRYRLLADHSNSTTNGVGFEVADTMALRSQATRGSSGTNFYSGTTTDNTIPDLTNFHMYAYTFDYSLGSANLKISLDDGTKQTFGTNSSANNANSTFAMHVGVSGDGINDWFHGNISEMSIWNRVLTDAEITSLYNSGSGKQISTDSVWKEEGT